jgi:hypothetical protein
MFLHRRELHVLNKRREHKPTRQVQDLQMPVQTYSAPPGYVGNG